jgi:hypothetical protein
MMFYYQCKRCNHKCNQKIEIRRHLERKYKCSKNINIYNYNDNILYELSFIKHKIDEEFDLLNILKNYNENNILNSEKKEYFCKNCDVCFQNKSNLNRHIKKNNCKINIINNITNNTLNQQNIININLNLIKPFD